MGNKSLYLLKNEENLSSTESFYIDCENDAWDMERGDLEGHLINNLKSAASFYSLNSNEEINGKRDFERVNLRQSQFHKANSSRNLHANLSSCTETQNNLHFSEKNSLKRSRSLENCDLLVQTKLDSSTSSLYPDFINHDCNFYSQQYPLKYNKTLLSSIDSLSVFYASSNLILSSDDDDFGATVNESYSNSSNDVETVKCIINDILERLLIYPCDEQREKSSKNVNETSNNDDVVFDNLANVSIIKSDEKSDSLGQIEDKVDDKSEFENNSINQEQCEKFHSLPTNYFNPEKLTDVCFSNCVEKNVNNLEMNETNAQCAEKNIRSAVNMTHGDGESGANELKQSNDKAVVDKIHKNKDSKKRIDYTQVTLEDLNEDEEETHLNADSLTLDLEPSTTYKSKIDTGKIKCPKLDLDDPLVKGFEAALTHIAQEKKDKYDIDYDDNAEQLDPVTQRALERLENKLKLVAEAQQQNDIVDTFWTKTSKSNSSGSVAEETKTPRNNLKKCTAKIHRRRSVRDKMNNEEANNKLFRSNAMKPVLQKDPTPSGEECTNEKVPTSEPLKPVSSLKDGVASQTANVVSSLESSVNKATTGEADAHTVSSNMEKPLIEENAVNDKIESISKTEEKFIDDSKKVSRKRGAYAANNAESNPAVTHNEDHTTLLSNTNEDRKEKEEKSSKKPSVDKLKQYTEVCVKRQCDTGETLSFAPTSKARLVVVENVNTPRFNIEFKNENTKLPPVTDTERFKRSIFITPKEQRRLNLDLKPIKDESHRVSLDLSPSGGERQRSNVELPIIKDEPRRINIELPVNKEEARRINIELPVRKEERRRLNLDLTRNENEQRRCNPDLIPVEDDLRRIDVDLRPGKEIKIVQPFRNQHDIKDKRLIIEEPLLSQQPNELVRGNIYNRRLSNALLQEEGMTSSVQTDNDRFLNKWKPDVRENTYFNKAEKNFNLTQQYGPPEEIFNAGMQEQQTALPSYNYPGRDTGWIYHHTFPSASLTPFCMPRIERRRGLNTHEKLRQIAIEKTSPISHTTDFVNGKDMMDPVAKKALERFEEQMKPVQYRSNNYNDIDDPVVRRALMRLDTRLSPHLSSNENSRLGVFSNGTYKDYSTDTSVSSDNHVYDRQLNSRNMSNYTSLPKSRTPDYYSAKPALDRFSFLTSTSRSGSDNSSLYDTKPFMDEALMPRNNMNNVQSSSQHQQQDGSNIPSRSFSALKPLFNYLENQDFRRTAVSSAVRNTPRGQYATFSCEYTRPKKVYDGASSVATSSRGSSLADDDEKLSQFPSGDERINLSDNRSSGRPPTPHEAYRSTTMERSPSKNHSYEHTSDNVFERLSKTGTKAFMIKSSSSMSNLLSNKDGNPELKFSVANPQVNNDQLGSPRTNRSKSVEGRSTNRNNAFRRKDSLETTSKRGPSVASRVSVFERLYNNDTTTKASSPMRRNDLPRYSAPRSIASISRRSSGDSALDENRNTSAVVNGERKMTVFERLFRNKRR